MSANYKKPVFASDDRGFTLLEVLLALAVFNILLIGLFSWLGIGVNVSRSVVSSAEELYNAEQALFFISDCVRQSAGDPEIMKSTQNGSDSVTCYLPVTNARGAFTGGTRRIKITHQGSTLYRSVDGAVRQPFADGIGKLTVHSEADGCLEITIITDEKQNEFSTMVFTRAK